jgi:S1-C subfamily serine protease
MAGAKRGGFTVVPFEVVVTDDRHDLALLRCGKNPFAGEVRATIAGEQVPVVCDVARLDTRRPSDGLPVACSGYPLMSFVLITNAGIVASSWSVDLKQLSESNPDDYPDVYLAGMQINGGNSGGPVYSGLDGAVIGVAVASRLAPSAMGGPGQVEDAGLTIVVPSKYVADLLDEHSVDWQSVSSSG